MNSFQVNLKLVSYSPTISIVTITILWGLIKAFILKDSFKQKHVGTSNRDNKVCSASIYVSVSHKYQEKKSVLLSRFSPLWNEILGIFELRATMHRLSRAKPKILMHWLLSISAHELYKEEEKDVFHLFILSQAWTKEKFWVHMRNQTSDLRITRSNALPLSQRDSSEQGTLQSLYITCILHTARISNVDVMFCI